MKNITLVAAVLSATIAFAAEKDPNRFADYGAAMKEVREDPSAVAWQGTASNELAEACCDSTVSDIACDKAEASVLCAKVRDAYDTDAITAAQIAAVTQWSAKTGKGIWAGVLLRYARESQFKYQKMFFLDQLRWCGKPFQARWIREIGNASGDAHVREFAMQVASEIDGTAAVVKTATK